MLYISGLYALNLPCNLETTGDWHTSSLRWDDVPMWNSRDSVFKDYGIERGKPLPEHTKTYAVANHIRAILDLLATKQFALISNFRDDFICNGTYTEEIFSKVEMLLPDEEISDFMHKTYGKEWRIWIGEHSMDR